MTVLDRGADVEAAAAEMRTGMRAEKHVAAAPVERDRLETDILGHRHHRAIGAEQGDRRGQRPLGVTVDANDRAGDRRARRVHAQRAYPHRQIGALFLHVANQEQAVEGRIEHDRRQHLRNRKALDAGALRDKLDVHHLVIAAGVDDAAEFRPIVERELGGARVNLGGIGFDDAVAGRAAQRFVARRRAADTAARVQRPIGRKPRPAQDFDHLRFARKPHRDLAHGAVGEHQRPGGYRNPPAQAAPRPAISRAAASAISANPAAGMTTSPSTLWSAR